MSKQAIEAERLLTSYEVGALLQVNPSSVNKWVKDGRLVAFRTPGGHRRIRAQDLVEFLDSHKMQIPQDLGGATRRRLLVVDDDVLHLQAIGRRLKPLRRRVDVCLSSNGVDALVQVGAFRPHLIVLDLYMPGLDGLEVCRRLKANELTSNIDVVIASGQLSSELELKAIGVGARRCMHKPIDFNLVLEDLGIVVQAGI